MGGDPAAVHWASIGSMVKKVYRADFGTARALVKRHGYMAVAFVRHPARRIVSAYINKLVAKGAALDELMPGALDAVTSIYQKNGRRLKADSFGGISLMELLDYVEDRAGLRIGALDGHWDMQVHESLLRSGLRFDHVCTVENLSEDFRPIQELCGSNAPIDVRNASNLTAVTVADDMSDTPSAHLSGRALNASGLLNRRVLERVAKIYEPDFAFLGYDPLDIDARPSLAAGNRSSYRHKNMAASMRSGARNFLARVSGWK